MPIFTPLDRVSRQSSLMNRAFNFFAVAIIYRDTINRQRHHVTIFKKDEALGFGDQGKDIRCDELFAFAKTHHQRAPLARSNERLRLGGGNHSDGISPFEKLGGL